ncbi:MAG: metallophosphoesterase [Deltaproteobacteria bacterium]|nr:metallophosphoesterase [Deltaproteobacteria bacterium]
MRLGIISDIHGNLEALKQVLADIDQSELNGVACLGDNIGYGPEPEEVVKLIRKRNIPSIMGNHELVVVDPRCLVEMNPMARKSCALTLDLLSRDTIDYIHGLRPYMVFHGALLVHGCPPDSSTTYLFDLSNVQLSQLFPSMQEKICFVGHTHDLEIISFDRGKVTRAPLPEGPTRLQAGQKYIINVGSVGQPRDGNNKAKYVIWDTCSQRIEVRFIPYDIAVTANKILKLGFPDFYARRLW